MRVVVVESPAKAKTVGRYLGRGCRVLACYGHVSDLPSKAGSVRPDEDFAMTYATTGRRAARALGSIRAALAGADGLFLATDPDREGEAIAWQVLVWLEERGAVGDRPVHRVAFHEVTPEAVRRAMAEPRGIDMDLVRAWQARRALDYLVGYGLSPLLWRKLPGCRSAGRVQSVALRLVCERESEIDAFAPRAYWTVGAEVAAGGGAAFGAALRRLDGAEIGEAGLAAERMASDAAARIGRARFRVASVTRDTLRRTPPPPFTTSTLQQEAARRLGFAPVVEAIPEQSFERRQWGQRVDLEAVLGASPWGDNVIWTWPQIGSSVTLNDADTATPWFTAPAVDADTRFTFTATATGRGTRGAGLSKGARTARVTVQGPASIADVSVTSRPADGSETFKRGDRIEVTVTFSEPVHVSGSGGPCSLWHSRLHRPEPVSASWRWGARRRLPGGACGRIRGGWSAAIRQSGYRTRRRLDSTGVTERVNPVPLRHGKVRPFVEVVADAPDEDRLAGSDAPAPAHPRALDRLRGSVFQPAAEPLLDEHNRAAGGAHELDGVERAKAKVRRNRPLHPVLAQSPDIAEHRTVRDRRPSALVARVHRGSRVADFSREVDERDAALDVARLGEAHRETGLGSRELSCRVPRLLVVLAADRAPVLAPVVLDGLERLARVAAQELVREHLADARRCLDTHRAPVLVHELADESIGVGPAEDRRPVLLMAKRPEDQHVLEPLDPAPFLDRGAPLGDDAFDVRAPAVFEPLGRFLVVLADEGVGDGVSEFRVRRHVVLPSANICSGPSRRLSPSSYRNDLHPLASTPDGGVG